MFLIFALLLAQLPQPTHRSFRLPRRQRSPWLMWMRSPRALAVPGRRTISQIYLAAMKRKDTATVLTHHLIDPKSGAVQKLDSEPAWAAKYWEWKSWKAAPGNPAFAITLDTQKKNESARPAHGGDLARGGVDPGGWLDRGRRAGQTSTNVQIITMLLKGEMSSVVGESARSFQA